MMVESCLGAVAGEVRLTVVREKTTGHSVCGTQQTHFSFTRLLATIRVNSRPLYLEEKKIWMGIISTSLNCLSDDMHTVF